MIVRPKQDMAPLPPQMMVRSALEEHLEEAERLGGLRRAYRQEGPITARHRPRGLPNNRLSHGYARYISTLSSGYLLGKPISYTGPEEDAEGLGMLREAFRFTDIDSVDAEIARNCAVYGKGVELVYADGDARPRSTALDPECAFVVYDDTVQAEPLFGVRYAPQILMDGTEDGFRVTVATDKYLHTLRADDLCGTLTLVGSQPHHFGQVPLIEYWNGEDERGDFESVLSLIDAYDILESDRVNDKEQFVNALMVLTGTRMETDEEGRTPIEQLRQDKMLFLPDSDARVQYLNSVMSETDAEVLRRGLKEDIHKFSMVPDLSDEAFAGNVSGVAMKYKLMGLEQLTRHKERWFREGLKQRLRCYAHFLRLRQGISPDPDRITPVFSRSLPVNETEVAQLIRTLDGIVPRGQLLTQVPFLTQDA